MAESIIIMLSVEKRTFHLNLNSANVLEVKKEFDIICREDATFLDRLKTCEPKYYWRKPEFKGTPFETEEFELLAGDKINNFSKISVQWIEKKYNNGITESLENDKDERTEGNDSETTNDKDKLLSNDTNIDSNNGNDDDDQGSRTPEEENVPSVPYDQAMMKDYYTQSAWNNLANSEQQNEWARLQQHYLLLTMSLPSTFTPCCEPESTNHRERRSTGGSTKKRSSTSAGEASHRRSSRRKVTTDSSNKENENPKVIEVPQFFQDDNEDEDEIIFGVHTETPGPSSIPQARPYGKAPKIIQRKYGSRFNDSNSLPNFSALLKEQLKAGILPRSYKYVSEIKTHMTSQFRNEEEVVFTKGDYDTVCQRVVKEYPILGDADNNKSFAELKYTVRKSFSTVTYYKNKGKARRQQRRLQQTLQNETRNENTPLQNTSQEELKTELQSGIGTEARQRFLIRATLQERKPHEVEVKDLEAFVESWPHYKNGFMLIYEYSLKEKYKLETLYQNAARFLEALKKHYSNEDALECISSLYEDLTPIKFKNQRVKPLISILEAVLADGVPEVLDDQFEASSPHLIVTTDYNDNGEKMAVAAVLKLTSNYSTICSNPNPATVLILSLAPYFLFTIRFPPAYESMLRLFEKHIHGSLSTFTAKTRAKKEYKAFIQIFKG